MFNNLEILDLRKKLYQEVSNVQSLEPEAKDFERIKPNFISYIAYEMWQRLNKPLGQDMDIWLEAESTWNFIRYMW